MEYRTTSHTLSHISTKLKATPNTQHLDSLNQRTEGTKCTTSSRQTKEPWEPSKEVDDQLVSCARHPMGDAEACENSHYL